MEEKPDKISEIATLALLVTLSKLSKRELMVYAMRLMYENQELLKQVKKEKEK